MNISEFERYIEKLLRNAFRTRPFDTLCTVLRVKGMSDANWDPFEESLDAFIDFDWLIKKSQEEKEERCSRRFALLIYCQMVEMTAVHEMLANLLRCIADKPYIISPFSNLQIRGKKQIFSWIPPSATKKFREIKKLADVVRDQNLPRYIDSIFNDHVRNAFSHSDYILTKKEFRYTEGGPAQAIKVSELDRLVNTCFDFYNAFIKRYREWRLNLARLKRFHKWPNYEVLELLSDQEEGIYGFHVHFSNGSKATYTRKRSGIEAINLHFEQDGSINYWIGPRDNLEKVWKVNGKPVIDWKALETQKQKNT